MTKILRQQQEYPFPNYTSLNYHKGSLIMCSLEGRDESPVSVISHSATAMSHPSSACASMEHHLNHIINPNKHKANSHPYQEQLGASSSIDSEDDNSVYNLPKLFFEAGAREEFPEAQNPSPSKAISRKAGNVVKLFQKKSFTTSETNLADSSSDDQPGQFSIDFQGLQDKSMVLRENFLKASESMLDNDEEKKAHDKLQKQYGEWKKDQKLINTPNGHLIKLEESTMATKRPVSKGFLKTVNLSDNAWIRGSNVGHNEEKGRQLGEGANLSVENAYQNESVRREIITSTKALNVPSKWDDAGKWLCQNNASNDKPNYGAIQRQLSQSINTSPRGGNHSNSAAPASQLLKNINVAPGSGSQYSVHVGGGLVLEERRTTDNLKSLGQRPTRDYNSISSGEILVVGANSPPNIYSPFNNPNMPEIISAIDSEINANCASDQHYKSSANYKHRLKQHQILQKLRRKYARNGGLTRAGVTVGEAAQNLGSKTIGRNNAVSRICNISTVQTSPQRDQDFTKDKYANTELEGKLDEDIIVRQIEFVVQTPKPGIRRSVSMKDACTEVSPSVSRRDMGTQMTPILASSRTPNCPSPIKNNSPARHNTPARRSTSNYNQLNDYNFSSYNDGINSGKDHLNLFGLESCLHWAKLELRDLPSGSQLLDESSDKNSAFFSNNWSPTNVAENDAVEMNANSIMRANVLEARAADWEEAERAKCNAKFKREEAKIDAWVNLQKAKAEAELKKLEVKLEKLRSQAAKKVMKKVVAVGKRAEEMQAAIELQQVEQMRRVSMERATNLRINAHLPANFAVCFPRRRRNMV